MSKITESNEIIRERIMVDRDGFDNQEDYNKYIEEHPEEMPIPQEMIEINANYNINVTATPLYKIVDNLSEAWTNAVQKTFILGSDIFILQRKGKNMRLTRCHIYLNTASAVDRMTLNNFGHSQTLDFIDYDSEGHPRFIIACEAGTTSFNWSKKIGRITYIAGTTKKDTDIPTLSAIEYANIGGTSFGELLRVDAALSTNKSRLVIWAKSSTGKNQYSVYNMSQISSIFDAKETAPSGSKDTPCTDSAVQAALLSSIIQNSTNVMLPNNSFQGLDLKNNDIIFIDGGKDIDIPKVGYITTYILSSGTLYMTWLFNATVVDNAGELSISGVEIESPQVIGDTLYCTFFFGNKDIANGRFYIYTIPISAFSLPTSASEVTDEK